MIDEEGAERVRAELHELAAAAPPVAFTAADVLGRGRRRRQLRRGAAVGGTAAALALVVGVPAVVARGGPAGTVGAASPRSAAASPTAGPAAPRVPGLSPAAADRIARGCALAYGGADGRSSDPVADPSGTPGPTGIPVSPTPNTPTAPGTSPTGRAAPVTPTPVATPTGPAGTPTGPTATPTGPADSPTGPTATPTGPAATPSPTAAGPAATPQGWDRGVPRLQDVVHVYNRVRDAVGEHVLVYGPWDYLGCDVGESAAKPFNAGGASYLDTGWLPGPVAVDALVSAPGGPRHPAAGAPAGPGYDLVEGRVSPDVARLTVSVGTDRAEVRPLNGTFLVRFVHSATWPAPAGRPLTVTAYDRAGRTLPGANVGSKRGCWVDPGGQVVIGDRANSAAACRPATRWH